MDRSTQAGMGIKTIVALLVGLALATVHHAEAQQPKKIPRVGVLIGDSASSSAARIDAFRRGLPDLGYVEGDRISASSTVMLRDWMSGFRTLWTNLCNSR
jgi:hypothetical protein